MELSNSQAIKKGKRAGTTDNAQSFIPSFEASKLSFENTIRPIANKTKIIVRKFFLKRINMKLILKFFLIILILYGTLI